MLFVDVFECDFIIGHGVMSPSINTTTRVALTLAIASFFFHREIVLWLLTSPCSGHYGKWASPGMYILRNASPKVAQRILVGYLVIFILSLMVVWSLRRKTKRPE
jgi:hypothetical protein